MLQVDQHAVVARPGNDLGRDQAEHFDPAAEGGLPGDEPLFEGDVHCLPNVYGFLVPRARECSRPLKRPRTFL